MYLADSEKASSERVLLEKDNKNLKPKRGSNEYSIILFADGR